MNKQKGRLETKLFKTERVLKELTKDEISQGIITEAFELLLDYKSKLIKQQQAQKRISPEKRAQYVRTYRLKQKMQSNVGQEIEEFLK